MQRVRMFAVLVAALCVFGLAQSQAQVMYQVPNQVVLSGTVQAVGPDFVTVMTPQGTIVNEPLTGTTFLSNGVTVSPMAGQVVTCYPYGYAPSASFLTPNGVIYDPYYQLPHRWDWNEYPGH